MNPQRWPTVVLYSLVGVWSVVDVVKRGRSRWFGHLEHDY